MATAGAEFMALETTEEAGTCLAFRSMLGLVGSSVGGGGQRCRGGVRAGRGQGRSPAALLGGGGFAGGLGWGTCSHPPQQSQEPPPHPDPRAERPCTPPSPPCPLPPHPALGSLPGSGHGAGCGAEQGGAELAAPPDPFGSRWAGVAGQGGPRERVTPDTSPLWNGAGACGALVRTQPCPVRGTRGWAGGAGPQGEGRGCSSPNPGTPSPTPPARGQRAQRGAGHRGVLGAAGAAGTAPSRLHAGRGDCAMCPEPQKRPPWHRACSAPLPEAVTPPPPARRPPTHR